MVRSVAGVWIRDGRLLLARRGPEGDMGGRWELPGGKCEGSETDAEALMREFREEFELEVRVGDALAETGFVHKGKEHRVAAYRIEAKRLPVRLVEHEETAWFRPGDLPPAATIVDSDLRLLAQITALPWLWG